MGGTHNRATVEGFYGAGKEDTSRAPTHFDMDEPPILLGENRGPNPVEYLLVALSGCLTTSLVAVASAKGVRLDRVSSRYQGTLDLRGFLNIADDVKVEYEKITILFKIEGDLSESAKDELIKEAQKFSPVFNSLAKPVQLAVQLERR
ncbi:osmotically inducible protein C [Geobacter sp. SVR]|nr:osmotically inducible protein C [Geobacter sp. SVR]GCF85913.1 osmotically inducible protein C [Geobacter sp. SVR]